MFVYLLLAILSGFASGGDRVAYELAGTEGINLPSEDGQSLTQDFTAVDWAIQMPHPNHGPVPHSPIEAESKTEKEMEKLGDTSSPVVVPAFFTQVLRSGKHWARPPTAVRYAEPLADPGISPTILFQVFRI